MLKYLVTFLALVRSAQLLPAQIRIVGVNDDPRTSTLNALRANANTVVLLRRMFDFLIPPIRK
jgi:DNA gyrase inhibitor GyrI